MPQPTPSDQHVDAVLTAFSVKYGNRPSAYIADKVFPMIGVQKQSDKYFVFDKDNWFRLDAKLRGPASESAGGGYTLSQGQYFAKVWAIHKDVDDDSLANYDNPLRPFRNATDYVTDQNLLRRDAQWATEYFKTGVWSTDQTGVGAAPGANQFLQFNVGGSTPIDVIQEQADAIEKNTGAKPNVLVIGADVKRTLFNHSTVLERIKYSERGTVTAEILASVLDVERVLVARAVYNTAEEGATASMDWIVDSKGMLLAYANPDPDIESLSAGYMFGWEGRVGANALTGRVSRFRMDNLKADRVEAETAYDMKAVATDCARFFATAVA